MTKKSEAKDEDVVIDETTSDAINDPSPEPEAEAQAESDPAAEVDLSDMMALIYVGSADKFTYGSVVLLPGLPALVPKEVAEGILTTPFEAVRIALESDYESPLEE